MGEIIANFDMNQEYIVYGTGNSFRFLQWLYGDLLKIRFCIDQKAENKPYTRGGVQCYGPKELCNHKNSKIIIAANGEYYSEIKENLLVMGFDENNVCSAHEIAAVWGMHYKNIIISTYVSFPILSACTLKCRGCIHYTGYHKKEFVLLKEDIIKSVDLYFQCVDYVDEVQIFGGEPFLHKDVGAVCRYISERYADRYQRMFITTNGTIIPKDYDIQCFRACRNLVISISDYSTSNADRVRLDELIKICEKNDIPYLINSAFFRTDADNLWFDCGNPTVRKDEIDVRQRFKNCSLSGSGVWKNRYYYCPNSMFANITDIYSESDDWLDLEYLAMLPRKERGIRLHSWHLGILEQEALGFCSYCAGFGKKINSNYIKAGMQ